MITKVLKNEKNHLEVAVSNLTIAEVVRTFLWEDSSVTMSAWKRKHPTEDPILIIKTSGKTAKKALTDTLEKIKKLNDQVMAEAKKIKK